MAFASNLIVFRCRIQRFQPGQHPPCPGMGSKTRYFQFQRRAFKAGVNAVIVIRLKTMIAILRNFGVRRREMADGDKTNNE